MKKIPTQTLIVLGIALTTGCQPGDEQLARLARESMDRQAEQNRDMAQLTRQCSENHRRIVEATAAARQEILALEQDVQQQRSRLEEERRALAQERYRESLLVPVITYLGLLLLYSLPLVLCWYLLVGIRDSRSENDAVTELLLRELASQ